MKIKVARYSKVFPVAAYGVNDRFEMECEIEEGEDQKTARKELVKEVREWCRESNANQGAVLVPGAVPEIQLKDIQALEKIEDFVNEHSKELHIDQLKIFRRVIENREVSSYPKLLKIINEHHDKRPVKKRKL